MCIYIFLHTHTHINIYTEKIPSMSWSLKRIFRKKEFPEPMDICSHTHRHHHLQNKWLLTTERQLKGLMQPVFTTFPSHKSRILRTNKYIAFSYVQSTEMQLAKCYSEAACFGEIQFQNKIQKIFIFCDFTALFWLNCPDSTVSS